MYEGNTCCDCKYYKKLGLIMSSDWCNLHNKKVFPEDNECKDYRERKDA